MSSTNLVPDDVEFDVAFDGGSEEDQKHLLDQFRQFWTVNDALDIPALKELWRDQDDYVYFNSNGHTYRGFQDWLGIWRYYGPRFKAISPVQLGDVKVMIRGDMAVITDDQVKIHRGAVGDDDEIIGRKLTGRPVMRATMVYTREDDGWKVVHAHFSPSEPGERPWAPEA